MNDIEKTFEYAKNSLTLSDNEKASGRAELASFMSDRPAQKSVRSPFSVFFFSPALRYAVAIVLFLAVGSGGVAYAAENAQPSSPLYAVRVKVNEPVQIALTFDQKDRADLEVRLVNERLTEVAAASVNDTLSAKEAALISDSLSAQIDNAQQDITELQGGPQPSDALDTASDLSATLSAHAAILEKVQEANPDASSSVASVVSTIADELSETNELVDTTQDTVTDSATTTLSVSTDEQAGDTSDALTGVKQQVTDALSSFDASDRQDVNASIADIQGIIADAEMKDAAGDSKSAYLLYTEANQKLTSLKLTIEADQTLNIDVIDASSTDQDASEENVTETSNDQQ